MVDAVSGCLNAGGIVEQPETVPALLRLAGKRVLVFRNGWMLFQAAFVFRLPKRGQGNIRQPENKIKPCVSLVRRKGGM